MAGVCTIAHVCVVKLPRSSTHVPSRTLRTPSSQPALLDHYPVSPFLDPRSLLISCSATEPYPSLNHVFGMNSASFLYLHHRRCQSQHIILIRLLYPSPSTQN